MRTVGSLFYAPAHAIDYAKQVVLFANGAFDPAGLPIEKVRACNVIAIDGGLLYCRALGIVPQLIVGDFDSVPEEVLLEYSGISKIKRRPNDSETDAEYALKLVDFTTFETATLLGGGGKRTDHLLGNLSLLARYPGRVFMDSLEVFTVAISPDLGNVELSVRKMDKVSLYPLFGAASGVSTHNLRWELQNATLDQSFFSQSNEPLETKIQVQVKSGHLLCFVVKES